MKSWITAVWGDVESSMGGPFSLSDRFATRIPA